MGFKTKIILSITALFFVGCMKQQSALEQSSTMAVESIGCENFQSKVFDSLYSLVENEQSVPNTEDLKIAIDQKIEQLALQQKVQTPDDIQKLKTEMNQLVDLLIEENSKSKNIKTPRELVQALIELEMEDISTVQNQKMNKSTKAQFQKVSALSQELNIQCSPSQQATNPTTPADTVPANVQQRIIAGANNVFATAYQSCRVLDLPEVTAETPDVVGIRRIGTHPDGIGGVREVFDLTGVQNTHPYIKVAAGNQNGCFNVRSNPLIYDYGGAPSVTNNTLNFFKNAGSGANVLGIDCSAYVSSAIGAAGFRYKPGVDNKAIYVRQNSSKFMNAKSSGFSCFDNISVSKNSSIKPGDIAAVNGHVVMVDRVGADPFGLKKINQISQCDNLNYRNFDFSISQSSPSKNGMGLNKYAIRDYLNESGPQGKMTVMFTELGQAACKAYFSNQTVTPASTAWGVIRHNGQTACLAGRVEMVQQSCVSACLK